MAIVDPFRILQFRTWLNDIGVDDLMRRRPPDHLIAGTCGGLLSTLAVHPLDLLKLRFAVNDSGAAVSPKRVPVYGSYWQCAKSIVAAKGIRGLYQGATPNLIGNCTAWGLYFQFYNVAKRKLFACDEEDLRYYDHLLAGMTAGSATLAVTNPIWVAKTRLCLQYEQTDKLYKGMIDTLAKTLRTEGIAGWYKGFLPGLLGTTHGALQFMAYDLMKKRYCRSKGLPISTKLDSIQYLGFAASSKMFAVLSTYPYQVIRARLQDHNRNYKGALDAIRHTWSSLGPMGFYKGLPPSLVRVLPATCITFLVYENVMHFLTDAER